MSSRGTGLRGGAQAPAVLAASPATVHWGFFDAALPPVLEVDSGSAVVFETVNGTPEVMPEDPRFPVLPELRAIHASVPRPERGHILTGPVHVRGARPGDVLEVKVESMCLREDWGWNLIRPGSGALPEDFDTKRVVHIPLDRSAGVALLPWGDRLPLAPFFGVIGNAPAPEAGRRSTIPPWPHGGNLDLKELVAGTTLFLPVHAEGALLSAGDGHAVQGDGEVSVTAIETGLTGTLTLTVRKDLAHRLPRAHTPSHLITLGLDRDLDAAVPMALREMLDELELRLGVSRADAYTLASLAVDLRVTQVVNDVKGVHAMIAWERLRAG